VRLTPDTNILVRAILGDDDRQSPLAKAELSNADEIALSSTVLCELVWVLSRGYKVRSTELAWVVRTLINGDCVVLNRPAAEAGLAMLDAGGDFADGVIAFEGAWLGGEVFLTFDQQTAERLRRRGVAVRLPS